jgi:hypothetical protein
MLYDVIECKLSVKSGKKLEYMDPYRDPIPGEIKEDHFIHRIIERFIRLIADYDETLEREDYQVLGELLYNLIFVGEIRKAFEGVYRGSIGKQVGKTNKRLRLTLEFHKDAKELSSYPWEFIFMPRKPKGSFLAGEIAELILTRFVPEMDVITGLPPAKSPLRIMIVYSHPKKLPTLEGVENVISNIQTLKSEQIHVDLLDNPTHDELSEAIPKDEYKPHIFHFIGHGEPGQIALFKGEKEIQEEAALENIDESDVDDYVWIPSGACCTLFDDHKPRLVFLQACSGGETELKSFTNLAQELICAQIPAVIAMQYEINTGDSSLFTTTVYDQISKGKPIGEAVKDGRRRLGRSVEGSKRENSWSDRRFATPIVYLQAEDTNIVVEEPLPEPIQMERCPYPYCHAPVTTNSKECIECHRPLEVCRNCGSVMGSDLGFCKCGFDLSEVSVSRIRSKPIKAQKIVDFPDESGDVPQKPKFT